MIKDAPRWSSPEEKVHTSERCQGRSKGRRRREEEGGDGGQRKDAHPQKAAAPGRGRPIPSDGGPGADPTGRPELQRESSAPKRSAIGLFYSVGDSTT
eukprot:6708099-Pyramimonas_sp.AAC.1